MATTRDIDRVIRTYIDPKVHDQYFNSTPLLNRFQKNSKKRRFGKYVEVPVQMAGGQAGSYGELEVIDRQRAEILMMATYYMKQYFAQLTVSWKDMLTCQGPEDVVDLLTVKKDNALETLRKDMTSDMRAGTSDDDMVGLTTLIYQGAAGAGGISSSYSWWVNKYANQGGAITYPAMLDMIALCSDGNIAPTLVVTDKFIMSDIWGSILQPMERYTQGTYNQAKELPVIAGIPLLTDWAFQSSETASRGLMYFIY
jgi:hypothetical protein